MEYLGIDMGSSYTKVFRISDGHVAASKQVPTPARLPGDPRRYEIDAASYLAAAEELLEAFRTPETCGLMISTQMHGCVLTDSRFRPLSPYISWQDGMGAAHLREIGELLGGGDAVAPAGVPLKGNLALCALLGRLLEEETIPRDALFCTLGGALIGRLTGRHVCHMSNAAPTGLCDIRAGRWNEPLICLAGLGGLVFPQILSELSPVGTWKGLLVYPDLGDQQVCALGANLQERRDLHISLGTAGLIGSLCAEWSAGPFEQRPYLTRGIYLRTISGLPGGRHVAAFERMLRQTAETLTDVAVPDETVWAFLSHVDAEGMPDRPFFEAVQGTPDLLAADFYAYMAQTVKLAADQLGVGVRRIAFSGGCAGKNPPLRAAFKRAFSCEADETDYDVSKGMRALAAMLERS